MGLDIFKEDVSSIKIRKNDYQKKIDEVIDDNNDISIASLNLLEMEEEKKIKKTPITIYLEEEELNVLKAVSITKNTTVPKTISNLLKSTVSITKSNLPSDFNIDDKVKQYDKENKVKKNKK